MFFTLPSSHLQNNFIHQFTNHTQPTVPLFTLTKGRARNFSFKSSLRWQVYNINSVDKTKSSCKTPSPTQYHSFNFRHRHRQVFMLTPYTMLQGRRIASVIFSRFTGQRRQVPGLRSYKIYRLRRESKIILDLSSELIV